MHPRENGLTKEKIIETSTELFSKNGFDSTSVDEIAREAGVNKALIYYYFKSKEDLLDQIVHSLLGQATSLAMDFVHQGIVQLIKENRLDIKPDKLKFKDQQALNQFVKNSDLYYRRLLDFVLEYKSIFRILMLESLKHGKHHKSIFRVLDLTKDDETNPIFKIIAEADHDFSYSEEMVLFRFFFTTVPLVTFAAYYDDYKEISGLSDSRLRELFLWAFQTTFTSFISGNEIWLKQKKTADYQTI